MQNDIVEYIIKIQSHYIFYHFKRTFYKNYLHRLINKNKHYITI